MRHGSFRGFLLLAVVFVTAVSSRVVAQVEQAPVRTPREFTELRGTWMLDERAGTGHIVGLPVARSIAISTTPTEIPW